MKTTQDTYGYESNSFEPGAVTVKAGGNVTWTYDASTVHNVTFSPATGAPANVPNGRSGSVSRSFTTAGDFDYSCTNHAGMQGAVKVVP
jgi:plastocyanin